MFCRPSDAVIALAVCAGLACTFDPSGLSGSDGDDPIDSGTSVVIDADPAAPDAADKLADADVGKTCSEICPGTCDEMDVCHITCGGDGGGQGVLPGGGGGGGPAPCDAAVICPAGFDCHVHCVGQNACQVPIDCTQSTNCRIDCSEDNSCGAALSCGAGLCDINCMGTDSCRGGIACEDACRCDVNCEGDSTCEPEAVCPPGCDEDNDCRTNSGSGCEPSC